MHSNKKNAFQFFRYKKHLMGKMQKNNNNNNG